MPRPRSQPRRAARGAACLLLALCAVALPAIGGEADGERPGIEPRLELVRADGTTAPLRVARVELPASRDVARDLRRGSNTFSATSGTDVVLVTEDPRAAFDRVAITVPSPVPAVLVARLPVADHPRCRDVTLVVRDEETARPLADAGFEVAEPHAALPSQRADAQGRITLHPEGGCSGIARWHRPGFWIHAPQHLGSDGTSRGRAPGSARWRVPVASDIDDVLAGRPIPVGLTRLPVEATVEVRRLRVVEAEGAPVAGAFVWLLWPIGPIHGNPLGFGSGPLGELCDGFRRTGPDGSLTMRVFPSSSLPVAGIEVRLPADADGTGGAPFLAYGLAYAALPKDGVREVRLPPVALVELTIEGLPPDVRIEVGADALGRARVPTDGPVAPMVYDPGVREKLEQFRPWAWAAEARGAVFGACATDRTGWFRRGGPPYRRPIPVGRATTLRLERLLGPRDAHGLGPVDRRRLDLTPGRSGPWPLTKRWEDLEPAD